MASEVGSSSSNQQQQKQKQKQKQQDEKRHRTIFDVPSEFFESCRLLPSPTSQFEEFPGEEDNTTKTLDDDDDDDNEETPNSKNVVMGHRWSCNTCKFDFDSLQEHRSHFKSDLHRFNIKLSIAGKDIMKEEDFDELSSESLFNDYDISSISGSEDEADRDSSLLHDGHKRLGESMKKKIFVHLKTGDRISVWRCLLLKESENISFEHDKFAAVDSGERMPCLTERGVIEKLKYIVHEPRNNTCLRVVLLAGGGHFAGCVFDGNTVVAHKTFHRYVVRAKAGKKQSSKDASGRAAYSAGASLRRYNELALKKEIQELLIAWKPYFDASSCIFIHAPSSNRQLLFDGEKPYFSCQHHVVRSVPMTVRRPTFKEARRIFNLLTQVSFEMDEEITPIIKGHSLLSANISNGDSRDAVEFEETTEDCSAVKKPEKLSISSESESDVICVSTPLHEAAKSGIAQMVLELLEQGSDPCSKDERGRTPYMLASEKEVRNTFRRFMACNLDRWDWQAAKVPSALTKEMEESQAAKQAEKDTKKKARAKELKKLRKEREKKAQAQAALAQTASAVLENRVATSVLGLKGKSQSSSETRLSKEGELKKAQADEREKRAAAAERRMAALNAEGTCTNVAPSSSQPKGVMTSDIKCSCCETSLVGKVPFHRYNYKYCSTSCMHVHREILEDG